MYFVCLKWGKVTGKQTEILCYRYSHISINYIKQWYYVQIHLHCFSAHCRNVFEVTQLINMMAWQCLSWWVLPEEKRKTINNNNDTILRSFARDFRIPYLFYLLLFISLKLSLLSKSCDLFCVQGMRESESHDTAHSMFQWRWRDVYFQCMSCILPILPNYQFIISGFLMCALCKQKWHLQKPPIRSDSICISMLVFMRTVKSGFYPIKTHMKNGVSFLFHF